MIKGGIWRNTEVSNMFLLLKLKKNVLPLPLLLKRAHNFTFQ